jgi:hypothetical protein
VFSKLVKKAAIFVAFFILNGCNSFETRTNKALDLAKTNNFKSETIKTTTFPIQVFIKNQNTSHAILYLEGDGLVLTSSGIAFNPTPTDPMALRLAIADQRFAKKIVINRPFQYADCTNCDNKYWTQARYSPEIISSIVEVIKKLKTEYNFESFDIVAYSGGAAVAFLIAPYFKKSIKSIITFAANVDPFAWCEFHETSPLIQSLDPMANIEILKTIPQIHFCGTSDQNTHSSITKNFQKKLNAHKSQIINVEGFDHDSNWPNYWLTASEKLK